jgi:hypothetical protein
MFARHARKLLMLCVQSKKWKAKLLSVFSVSAEPKKPSAKAATKSVIVGTPLHGGAPCMLDKVPPPKGIFISCTLILCVITF